MCHCCCCCRHHCHCTRQGYQPYTVSVLGLVYVQLRCRVGKAARQEMQHVCVPSNPAGSRRSSSCLRKHHTGDDACESGSTHALPRELRICAPNALYTIVCNTARTLGKKITTPHDERERERERERESTNERRGYVCMSGREGLECGGCASVTSGRGGCGRVFGCESATGWHGGCRCGTVCASTVQYRGGG